MKEEKRKRKDSVDEKSKKRKTNPNTPEKQKNNGNTPFVKLHVCFMILIIRLFLKFHYYQLILAMWMLE